MRDERSTFNIFYPISILGFDLQLTICNWKLRSLLSRAIQPQTAVKDATKFRCITKVNKFKFL